MRNSKAALYVVVETSSGLELHLVTPQGRTLVRIPGQWDSKEQVQAEADRRNRKILR